MREAVPKYASPYPDAPLRRCTEPDLNIPGGACRSNALAPAHPPPAPAGSCQAGPKVHFGPCTPVAPGGILGPTPGAGFSLGALTREMLMKKWSAPKAVVIRLGMEINSYVAHR